MKPELSIILPSIRAERLEPLYDSLVKSTECNFELVICGPYALPQSLQERTNVKYAKDYGSPVRASNIAASLCEGSVYTWVADDCLFFEGTLDKCLKEHRSMGEDKKNVLVAKYYEGQIGSQERETLQPDNYFKVGATPASSPLVPADWWLFNIAFVHQELFNFLGGWDCEFEGTWASHADMAIRAQQFGATVKMAQIPLFTCDHMPGGTGDHMPIFECQTQHDEPLLQSRYRNPNWTARPARIQLDNWKKSQAVWSRRFKEEKV